MKNRIVLSTITCMALVQAGPAPASTKPCRDKDGRVIQCVKARKSSQRCKDASGRFTACATPADAAGHHGADRPTAKPDGSSRI